MFFLHALNLALFFFFAISVIYVLVFSIAGNIHKAKVLPEVSEKSRIAVLIPAYREDDIIVSVAEHMIQLDYPASLFTIFVIADHFKPETISKLKAIGVTVYEVNFLKSTKTKSLNHCLTQLSENDFDIILICDADNILSKNALQKINNAFKAGFLAIQCQRVAKNLNSNFAVLDAASEVINNHIFRKGANALGLSACLIGSGMAFGTKLIKESLGEIDAVGGFDKLLQLKIIEQEVFIKYLPEVLVFDEKIESLMAFKRQRRRWISSQYLYLRQSILIGFKFLKRGQFDYFNIGILQNIFLSRIITLGALMLITGLFFLLPLDLNPGKYYWLVLTLLFCFALLIALPRKFYNLNLLKASLSLPAAFMNMLLALLKIKGANENFIHTKHTKTSIDNPIFHEDEKR